MTKATGTTVVTKATGTIVTGTAAQIVTAALAAGPATARELLVRLVSQRRPHRISYANVRQVLHRLHEAGVVTRVHRGLYALSPCDITLSSHGSAPKTTKPKQVVTETAALVHAAIEDADDLAFSSWRPIPDYRPCATAASSAQIPTQPLDADAPAVTRRTYSDAAIDAAVAGAWAHFEAMNDRWDERAWA